MIVIFAGPTLTADEIRGELDDVVVAPPVAQGDLWHAARGRPWGIGVIDGYFERLPAVWHKEILWAMAEGVHVFGAASMGALRAAELSIFGMVGVGSIFEAFESGALERDDEVTIAHGSAEFGYRASSVALVDIRATLAAAVQQGVLSAEAGLSLVDVAGALHYPERAWPAVLAGAVGLVESDSLEALRGWLPNGQRSQKRADALAMLRTMREEREREPGPKRVTFKFEHTDYWLQACASSGRRPLMRDAVQHEVILDELRLRGEDAYRLATRAGTERALALSMAQEYGLTVSDDYAGRVAAQVQDARGLDDAEALREWKARQGLTDEQFERLIRREAQVRRVREMIAPEIAGHVLDHLTIDSAIAPLRARARDKQAALDRGELSGEIDRESLIRWYFEQRLERVPPADLDAYVRGLDLPHRDVLLEIIEREYWFVVNS